MGKFNILKNIDFKDILIMIGLIMAGAGIWQKYDIWISIIIVGWILFFIGLYSSLKIRKDVK